MSPGRSESQSRRDKRPPIHRDLAVGRNVEKVKEIVILIKKGPPPTPRPKKKR